MIVPGRALLAVAYTGSLHRSVAATARQIGASGRAAAGVTEQLAVIEHRMGALATKSLAGTYFRAARQTWAAQGDPAQTAAFLKMSAGRIDALRDRFIAPAVLEAGVGVSILGGLTGAGVALATQR
jgi:hypothetical protein